MDLQSCNCGQTYNPEISPAVCPNASCGLSRSLTKGRDESPEDFNARLDGEGGREVDQAPR